MKSHYTIKQKYFDHAPKWTIDGGQKARSVTDTHYIPENADRREPDALDSDLLLVCLAWSLVGAIVMASIVYWAIGA